MFEVTGSDIERLSDGELRSLVLRLATSELRMQGLPLSSVTAGGHQDAADGGLDVRVECPVALPRADFVPRQRTGFQVKKPDMTASAIRDEMQPKGVLRPVIAELAAQKGSYVMVSAQGSVADKPLRDRREAMRAQLTSLATPGDLHTDFYDRDRLAAWVNEFPGIAAWVRACANRPLEGWSSIDRWGGVQASGPFLTEATTCLVDESSTPVEALQVLDGIQRLRSELRRPGRCVRLIGLSGLGKTRLVQALFEKDVGDDPLDMGLAVYTDYSTETRPSARDMARELIGRGEPTILIVDNCNPETHAELAKLCSAPGSPVSLLTVEYDVREDEPEHTEVFRLQAASTNLLEQWLAQSFEHISQVDRRTIAEFSHGNFRIARALAETLARGETLGQVKSRELFERIFRQRNAEDKSLLMAAGDLALAYSVNGEDIGVDGELAQLAAVRDIPIGELYEAITELRCRDVAQARGRWRAVLPQAIANGLATQALARIPPSVLDSLMRLASPRLRTSIARRLGNLHDSSEARAAAMRWFATEGPLGDLFVPNGEGLQIVTSLAPLAPAEVLARIEAEVAAHPEITRKDAGHRWEWIRLIKALGYEGERFAAAAMLLTRFMAAEAPDDRASSAHDVFAEMFHVYLSGTLAPPAMRRDAVKALLNANSQELQACGLVALEALLKTAFFSSISTFDFGARSRSWGWEPQRTSELSAWFAEAVRLCVQVIDRFDQTRRILASNARDLWHYQACHDALDDAVTVLLKKGPWIEGWLALRATHRFDGDQMPPAWRERLEALIDRVKPIDLLHRARAAVLSRNASSWDISDGEDENSEGLDPWVRAGLHAQAIGRELASDAPVREEFMRELMAARDQQRAFECGMGLAEGAADLAEMWGLLVSDFESCDVSGRRYNVLAGFIQQASILNRDIVDQLLEDAMARSSLIPTLPSLQARVAMDEGGIDRLRRALQTGAMDAWSFVDLAYGGAVEHAPPETLADLLRDIAGLPGGTLVALDILHMRFFASKSTEATAPSALIEIGRDLLATLDLKQVQANRGHGVAAVIKICCSGHGRVTAEVLVQALHAALVSGRRHVYEVHEIFQALCTVQPHMALDVFVLSRPSNQTWWRFELGGRKGIPYKLMGSATLQSWAAVDPAHRYALLGAAMSLFSPGDFDEGAEFDPLFVDLLRLVPDKAAFLGHFADRVRLGHWTGSMKDHLEKRRVALVKLASDMPGDVADWVNQGLPHLDRWIASASRMDSDREESFE